MVTFDETGARAFGDLSEQFSQRRVATVVDGEVLSAPLVQERIDAGRIQITMGGSSASGDLAADANDLAMALRAGLLPYPLVAADETVVTPTFGGGQVTAALAALVLLGFVIAALAVWRLRGWAFALVLAPLCGLAGLAGLAVMSATGSLFLVVGLLLGMALARVATVLLAARRDEPKITFALGIVPRAALAVLGGALLPMSVGPLRAAASGLFASVVVGVPLGALIALAYVALFSSGPRAR